MNTVVDDGAFYDGLVASVLGLRRTALHLTPKNCEYETREFFVRRHILTLLRQQLYEQARPTLMLNPRVRDVIEGLEDGRLDVVLRSRQRFEHSFLMKVSQ